MYPDVEVLKQNLEEPQLAYENVASLTPATVVVARPQAIPVKILTVEIYDQAQNRLVTAIEILSPVNKRPPGLQAYRQKRSDLFKAHVHLLEVDLLRRGTRPALQTDVPLTAYQVLLSRANTNDTVVWALDLADQLPRVPVPLLPADDDAAS